MQLAEKQTSVVHVVGHVKWFDASKGFGFIVSDEGGSDVLLHVNVLRNFGQNSVADGARIEVNAHRTERGVQAIEVLQIEAPAKGPAPLADLADLDDVSIEDLPLEPARVKWFDKAKGFGFANIFGRYLPAQGSGPAVRHVRSAARRSAGAAGDRRAPGPDGRRGSPMGRRALFRQVLTALALAAGAAQADAACRDSLVSLRGDWGETSFSVEIADDPQERAQGLMFREALDPAAGMLFIFERPHEARFWMKNTLIPLDMIFLDPTGTVRHVHSRAVPGDLTPISGGEGILKVLEINGGLAESLGIAPGSEMRHPSIDPARAAWPC